MDRSEWFRIGDDEIDVDAVMLELRRRIAARQGGDGVGVADPERLAQELYRELVADRESGSELEIEDCDILPENYVIDWRIPIIGPIHAMVRRVINAEIQRYLQAGLSRQARLNRQMMLELHRLTEANRALRERLDALEARVDGHDAS